MTRRLAWTLAGMAALANVLGYALSLYRLAWFDEAIHVFTLFALTCLAARSLRAYLPPPARLLPFLFIVASAGVTIGALWEIAEWGYDSFSPRDVIRGKDDTMVDLVLDTLGALAAALLAAFSVRGSRQ